ncbi:MAG: ATP-binding protein [Pirellulales bacterium]|nr:ATP-binding protein [Pirellulales bacterium]
MGLVEVVKLLNPDEGIEKVAFQVAALQGWDDVVVVHSNGKRFFQVKHTREEHNLTFGSLVEVDDSGKSLLGSLFEGARNGGLLAPAHELVLYTNREDGSRWSTRQNGDRRPPLLEFWQWLQQELESSDLADISVPSVDDKQLDYAPAWGEWIACFRGHNHDATEFLKRLHIRTKEDDLDGLESDIRTSLADAFGITNEQAAPLFDALCRELRTWTTGHDGVTVEDLCSALTLAPASKDFAPAPPPPSPFFPTRLPVAEQLQRDLLDENVEPVVFLTGEPGAGKTSAVSWLANRRTDQAFQGIIGVRFFCFEPIRPEQPFISPDSSRVTPEELWLSLLNQLRRGLTGRLNELKVPLRNEFLSWQEAREHVLRLADTLGQELGRRFVIAIDGIDHAARASQILPDQVGKFFSSLPSPDETHSRQIRLLIAGQPSQYYMDRYPTWLTIEHPKVRCIDLPVLEQVDIKCLLQESSAPLNRSQTDDVARLINRYSLGNTLSVVFAVAEAELCNTLEELESRLDARSLKDGLSQYYDSIWTDALGDAKDLSCPLAGAISLARTPITSQQLSRIFGVWEKPVPWWEQVLNDLGPLLRREGDRYLIRHNDVRVFLASRFNAFNAEERRTVASQIVDYYADSASDRLGAHLQLFSLLRLSGRIVEAATLFDVDWVLEGAVLGIEANQLHQEGEAAVASLPFAKDWCKVVSVSCALDTLDRVNEFSEHYLQIEPLQNELPPFLPAEAGVRPLDQWQQADFHQLVWDAHELVAGGDDDRALGLLSRWLGDLRIDDVVRAIPDLSSDVTGRIRQNDEPRLSDMAVSDFEVLGSLSAKLKWEFGGDLPQEAPAIEEDAFHAFERGFVDEVTALPSVGSATELFAQHEPLFFTNFELAIRNLAKAEAWDMVAETCAMIEDHIGSLSNEFLLEASWYALRAGVASGSDWILNAEHACEKLPRVPKHHAGSDLNLAQYVNTARSLGWSNTSLDTGDIADLVYKAFEPPDKEAVINAWRLLFRAAAVVGRLDRYSAQADWESASALFAPDYIQQLLQALWGDVIYMAPYEFVGRKEAATLAEALAEYCGKLGGSHDHAAFDAALPFAMDVVRGSRVRAIWDVVNRHGRLDVLREWVRVYIGDTGRAWEWATQEAREAVREFSPLARSIGMHEVADYAESRASNLIVGYVERKEYSFSRTQDWFADAAQNAPEIWSSEGWRLWELCRICDEKGGDNRVESEILTSISAAAIRSGKITAWWRLASTTFPRKCERDWHYQLRQQFVEGFTLALAQGLSISDDEILQTWSVALSLSYWHENGDTSALMALRDALLKYASLERRGEFKEAMGSVSPVVLRKSDEEDREHSTTEDQGLPPVGPRSESEWWKELEDFLKDQDDESRYWRHASGLLAIAHRRAQQHGNDALIEGLRVQLDMHMRWAFGGERGGKVSALPDAQLESADEVFVELSKVLLDTFSVEVTVAALEGIHSYVAQRPTIISRLFDEVAGEWPRRWLLSAAESWAVLYPDSLSEASAKIESLLQAGDFVCRLQAWIVLTRNAQALGVDGPAFSVPDKPERSVQESDNLDGQLLEIPPTELGSVSLANKFSSVHMLLRFCGLFGFRFEKLEGLIAKELIDQVDRSSHDRKQHGPHRHGDFTYVTAQAEKAFGNAVSSILSADWCGNTQIAKLCQAILPNEDAWIQRRRPGAIRLIDDWPAESEYGGQDVDLETRCKRMLEATKGACVEDRWRVIAARTRDFTWKEDYDLHYWFEEAEDSFLITVPKVPTCPGGRSFVWWIGEPLEIDRGRFVSGLFVGGHQRLSHCHFEIRPPLEWRDGLGWLPNPQNPLEWFLDGEVVARYERIHGALRSNPHGPKYRQPIIDRWIVTHSAFDAMLNRYPHLRERHTFDSCQFKD